MKEHHETIGSDIYFHYLDYGNDFTSVYMSKILHYVHIICAVYFIIYTSMKWLKLYRMCLIKGVVYSIHLNTEFIQ